jgi:hypothetical protein
VVKIIGLSGYARSGKDTVADILVRDHGFTRLSFAQPMRDALYALNPIVSIDNSEKKIRVQDVISEYGWDGYKESFDGKEIRELMQRLGTEVGREMFGEAFWVMAAEGIMLNLLNEGKRVVFTDVRFPNEAAMIEEYNAGEVWRVRRPGVFPANSHASEAALDDYEFDRYIDNNGTINDLTWVVAHHVA